MKISRYFLFFFFLIAHCFVYGAAAEDTIKEYFNIPSSERGQDACGSNLIRTLRTVAERVGAARKVEVDIAVYSIDDSEIIRALEGIMEHPSAREKVKMRILCDLEQMNNAIRRTADRSQPPPLQRLVEYRPSIEIRTLGRPYERGRYNDTVTMHLKMAIINIDDREFELITGSFNWTNAARTTNYENCLFIPAKAPASAEAAAKSSNLNLIETSQGMFNKMWEGSRCIHGWPASRVSEARSAQSTPVTPPPTTPVREVRPSTYAAAAASPPKEDSRLRLDRTQLAPRGAPESVSRTARSKRKPSPDEKERKSNPHTTRH
jgi:hypothetical protein